MMVNSIFLYTFAVIVIGVVLFYWYWRNKNKFELKKDIPIKKDILIIEILNPITKIRWNIPTITIGNNTSKNANSLHIQVENPTAFNATSLLNSFRSRTYNLKESNYCVFVLVDLLKRDTRKITETLVCGTDYKTGIASMLNSSVILCTPIPPFRHSENDYWEKIESMVMEESDSFNSMLSFMFYDLSYMYDETVDLSVWKDTFGNMMELILKAYQEDDEVDFFGLFSPINKNYLIPIYPKEEVFWQTNANTELGVIIDSLLRNDKWANIDLSL
ncbi:MAG: hypothetical protein ACE5KE_11590 [Methanosarcinales archaeon]